MCKNCMVKIYEATVEAGWLNNVTGHFIDLNKESTEMSRWLRTGWIEYGPSS